MSLFQWLVAFFVIGSATFLAIMIGSLIYDMFRADKKKTDPANEKSYFWLRWKIRRKEKEVLNKILKDIRENRQDWMVLERNLAVNDKLMIVNDYTGLGFCAFQASDGDDTVIIINNLIENGTFVPKSQTTVNLEICGPHVRPFMKNVMSALKTRETQIDTFRALMREKNNE